MSVETNDPPRGTAVEQEEPDCNSVDLPDIAPEDAQRQCTLEEFFDPIDTNDSPAVDRHVSACSSRIPVSIQSLLNDLRTHAHPCSRASTITHTSVNIIK